MDRSPTKVLGRRGGGGFSAAMGGFSISERPQFAEDRGHIVHGFRNLRDASRLVHSLRSSVVSTQGEGGIVLVTFQERLQQFGSGLHVLLGIKRIVDIELLGGGGQ